MILVTTWFGSFLLDGEKVVEYKLFPKNPMEIAARMKRVNDFKILKEERELVQDLDEFFVVENRLEKVGGVGIDIEVPFIPSEDYEFGRDLLHKAMILVAKEKMSRTVGRDDHLSQAINALDDLEKAINILHGRLREWYGLHFPELEKIVDGDKFIQLVSEFGSKVKIPEMEDVESIGFELTPEDEKSISELAGLIEEAKSRKDSLQKYIETGMRSFAPNVTEIVGPIIGARLIDLAGSLERLARLPSGTIQLLGAEKALFRHLKSKAKPPKHGVLFQHPDIHRSPYWQRGAIARAYAGKIGIASRADYYSQRFIAAELRERLVETLKQIRESRKEAPVPRRRRTKRRRR
ncbi:MAG: NOP5/NOP56 family protein [Thermoplasmata archaeon]